MTSACIGSCSGFFDSSIKAFSPSAASAPGRHEEASSSSSDSPADNSAGEATDTAAPASATGASYGAAAFSAAASAASTATSVGVSAAQTATAAGGWFARRLSSEYQVFLIGLE